MKIRLNPNCSMGDNFSFGNYSKENRAFLRAFPTAVVRNCTRHNMNYYKMGNGFLVHVYNAYEINEK